MYFCKRTNLMKKILASLAITALVALPLTAQSSAHQLAEAVVREALVALRVVPLRRCRCRCWCSCWCSRWWDCCGDSCNCCSCSCSSGCGSDAGRRDNYNNYNNHNNYNNYNELKVQLNLTPPKFILGAFLMF